MVNENGWRLSDFLIFSHLYSESLSRSIVVNFAYTVWCRSAHAWWSRHSPEPLLLHHNEMLEAHSSRNSSILASEYCSSQRTSRDSLWCGVIEVGG